MNTFATIDAKFQIYCPNCCQYVRRVPQEPAHARLMQSLREGKTEGVAVKSKCVHCEKELVVTTIKI